MLETKITTMRAVFARVEPGESPSVVFHKIPTRPDGKQKYISISVPIRDERLLARIGTELHCGDEIEVRIETRWAEGDIPQTLLDFAKIGVPQDKILLGV